MVFRPRALLKQERARRVEHEHGYRAVSGRRSMCDQFVFGPDFSIVFVHQDYALCDHRVPRSDTMIRERPKEHKRETLTLLAGLFPVLALPDARKNCQDLRK